MNEKNIQKHIVNISFNMGILRANKKIEKIDVNSGFEDFVMDKAIEFERDFEKIKKEYNTDDYYTLIDNYSENVIQIWDKEVNASFTQEDTECINNGNKENRS